MTHTSQYCYYQEKIQQMLTRMKRLEPFTVLVGIQNDATIMEKQIGDSSKS